MDPTEAAEALAAPRVACVAGPPRAEVAEVLALVVGAAGLPQSEARAVRATAGAVGLAHVAEAPATPAEGGGDSFITVGPASADQIHHNKVLNKFKGRKLLAGRRLHGAHGLSRRGACQWDCRVQTETWMVGLAGWRPEGLKTCQSRSGAHFCEVAPKKAPNSPTDSPPTTHQQPHDSPR